MQNLCRFLVEERISLFQISEIKFLCPQRISAAEIKSDPSEVSMYLRNAFLAELNKKDAHCKFILASYYEEYVLLIIWIQAHYLFYICYYYINKFLKMQQPLVSLCDWPMYGVCVRVWLLYATWEQTATLRPGKHNENVS